MRSLSLNLCLCTADLKFHTEQAVQRIENLWLECHPNEIRSRCEPISFEGRVHGIADSTIVWRPAIDRTALDRFETGISEAEFTKFEILRVCVRPLKFFYHRLIYLRYRVAKATYRPYDLSTRPSSDGVFDYRAEAEPTNFNVSEKNEHRSTIAVLYNAVTVLSVRSQVLLPTEERYFLAYEQLAGFSETSFRVWQRLEIHRAFHRSSFSLPSQFSKPRYYSSAVYISRMAEGSPKNATFRVSSGAVRFLSYDGRKNSLGRGKRIRSSFTVCSTVLQFFLFPFLSSFWFYPRSELSFKILSFELYPFVYVEFQTT